MQDLLRWQQASWGGCLKSTAACVHSDRRQFCVLGLHLQTVVLPHAHLPRTMTVAADTASVRGRCAFVVQLAEDAAQEVKCRAAAQLCADLAMTEISSVISHSLSECMCRQVRTSEYNQLKGQLEQMNRKQGGSLAVHRPAPFNDKALMSRLYGY